MTDLPHIISLHRAGAASPASGNAAGAEGGDLLGFLSQLLGQSTGDASAAGGTDTLAAQVSASLQGMSLTDIKAKLADLLQGQPAQAATADTAAPAAGTPDSLLHNLMAKLEAQMQAQQPTPGSPIAQKLASVLADGTATTADAAPSLAEMLNAIEPGSGNKTQVEQALAQTDKTTDAEQPLDPAILDMLKDKVAALQMSSDGADQKDLVKIKEDMVKALQDQGLDASSVDRYLGALAAFLRGPDATATTTATAAPASAADADDTAPIIFAPASAGLTAKPAAAPKAGVKKDAAEARLPAEKAPTGANAETTDADNKTPAARGNQASAPAAAAPAQANTARVSGAHLSPAIVSALAGGETGIAPAGSDLNSTTALGGAAPSIDTATNGTGLVNYMSSAKGMSSTAVTQMVTLQLQQNMQNRTSMMTLQLHPADLGQLDIKLKFERDGQVRAHLSADKPETLSMLQKDSAYLEKTLQQNGVKLDENSITFDLRQQGRQQNMGGNDNGAGNGEQFAGRGEKTVGGNLLQASIAVQAQGYITQSGVNIMV